MVIYEVNLDVEAAIDAEFRAWLPGHIRHVTACPGFQGATWFERQAADEKSPSGAARLYTVHYVLSDRQALEDYLRRDAPALRQEGLERFGAKLRTSRRILTPVEP